MNKKISLILTSAVVFFASCGNTNSGQGEVSSSQKSDTTLKTEDRDEIGGDTIDTLEASPVIEEVKKAETGKKDPETKTQPIEREKSISEAILGKWKWDRTVCCGRMQQTISDTSSVAVIYHFRSDGHVEVFHDDELQEVREYKITYGQIYPDRPEIQIGERLHGPALLSIEDAGTTLVLNYGYMDMQVEFFRRKE